MTRLGSIAVRTIALTVALSALAYALDTVTLRLGKSQTSSVMVRPYFAVPKKNGLTEFMFQQPQPQSCVNSLFPHFGFTPCWWLRRHTEQRISL
ncbi:MAG: hypothetical protein JO041_00490 [Acidobacteria bacterium]|nr:hypothetical protein [Acidobacteriota bacterium]